MVIERLHFEPPAEMGLTDITDPIAWAVLKVLQQADRVEHLAEGTYDVTPRAWKHNTARHVLTVFENGKGMYRTIPIFRNSGTAEMTRDNPTEFKPGGRIQQLPEDGGMVMVASPSQHGEQHLEVHEIIFHLPGRSPR